MNKSESIDAMASAAGISKASAKLALEAFLDNVVKTLKKKDGKVALVGFGTFSTKRRDARKGRNPQTGAEIQIAAKTVVNFKAGKEFSEAVNK